MFAYLDGDDCQRLYNSQIHLLVSGSSVVCPVAEWMKKFPCPWILKELRNSITGQYFFTFHFS